ncbi:MAG: hypothetical protein HFJ79_09355 [Clostridiales bacterium]|nr:hypothetical protein [Clostridiales bacterium]
MSKLRRVLPVLLSLSLMATAVVPTVSLSAAGSSIEDGYRWNVKDGSAYTGTIDVYAAGKSGDSLTLKVDGKTVNPTADEKPQIKLLYKGGDGNPDRDIKTDSTYGASNMIGLNDAELGRLPSDGSVGFSMDADQFVDGDNKVYVLIGGYWGATPYDETKAHGHKYQTSDKDDFLMSNVRFLLPDGTEVTPSKLITYKGKAVGSKERVVETLDPYPYGADDLFWLGDGWGDHDTWANHTDPRYDIPYKVEFVLDYDKAPSDALFSFNSADFADGEHTVELYAGSTRVANTTVTFDNTDPVATANVSNYKTVKNGFQLDINFSDATSGLDVIDARLEGNSIGQTNHIQYTLSGLSNGVQSLVLEASDKAGNTVFQNIYFTVADETVPIYSDMKAENGTLSLKVGGAADADVTFYEADALDFTASYGTVDSTDNLEQKPASEQSFPEWYAYQMANGGEKVSTTSSSGMPYHAFDVNVGGATSGKVNLSYTGSTTANERFALQAYNFKTNKWDKLAVGIGSATLSATVDVADYAKDGKIRAMAIVDYVGNGSDTLLWSTDPQHYTVFEDLNTFYEQVYQFMGDEYKAGRAAYSITTGDIVDDSPVQDNVDKQWVIADKAIKLMEQSGMPNGTVTGNHDTANYPSHDYSKYTQWFGADRYRSESWFGGSLNNNSSHYDLITIGNTDFVVIYLGYGVEGTPETVAWANDILQRYSHRNAILATHQYLKASTGAWDPTSRADVIYNEIVVPNENVKMMLCGHDNGAVTLTKNIGERKFYEILSDYQFVQVEDTSYYEGAKDPLHKIGNMPYCNGEGYIRSMQITGNSIHTKTFSPVTGGTNPFGIRDEFTIDVDLQQANRVINTESFSASILGDKIADASVEAGKTATASYTGSARAWAATVTADGATVTTAAQSFDKGTEPSKPSDANTPVDLYALKALIETGKKLSADDYMADSFHDFQQVLAEAETLTGESGLTDEVVTAMYTKLHLAIGALEVKKEGALDPKDLHSMHEWELTTDAWKNAAGPASFDDAKSYISVAVGADGSLTFEKTKESPNNWPAIVQKGEAVTITPVNGKIYLNMDIVASSAWSMCPVIKQGNKTVSEQRWNYIIEGLADKEADAGPGTFKGVYDVTQLFLDLGFDLTKPLSVSMLINVVPGPVTINHLELMTEKPDPDQVDRTGLEEAILRLDNLNPDDFTADSVAKVEEKLLKAIEVYGDENATQDEVNLAAKELNDAIDALVPVSGPTEPSDPTGTGTNPTGDPTTGTEPTGTDTTATDATTTTTATAGKVPGTGEDTGLLYLLMGVAVAGAGLLAVTFRKAKNQ